MKKICLATVCFQKEVEITLYRAPTARHCKNTAAAGELQKKGDMKNVICNVEDREQFIFLEYPKILIKLINDKCQVLK